MNEVGFLAFNAAGFPVAGGTINLPHEPSDLMPQAFVWDTYTIRKVAEHIATHPAFDIPSGAHIALSVMPIGEVEIYTIEVNHLERGRPPSRPQQVGFIVFIFTGSEQPEHKQGMAVDYDSWEMLGMSWDQICKRGGLA